MRRRPASRAGFLRSAKCGVGRTRRVSSVPGGPNYSESAPIFVLRQGGIEKAKASLSKLKDDPVMSFAVAAGDIKAARKSRRSR